MKKQTYVTLLRLLGSLVALLAAIAVMCLLGLLFLVSGLPHSSAGLSMTGVAGVAALFLCGAAALLFHRAHTVEAELSQAEQAEQAQKRGRREYVLFGLFCFGLSGVVCLFGALQGLYRYYTNAAFAGSISPGKFWTSTLFEGGYAMLQLIITSGYLLSTRSSARVRSSPIA